SIATATAGEVAGGGAPPRNRCGAGVAVGPMGPIRGGPAGNSPGVAASRRRLRLPDRSPGSDNARGPGHGRATGRLRRVRTGDSARTGARRPGPRPAPRPAERQEVGPAYHRRTPRRTCAKAASCRREQSRDRSPPADRPHLRAPYPGLTYFPEKSGPAATLRRLTERTRATSSDRYRAADPT